MIILSCPANTDALARWKSRLEAMSVPHLIIASSSHIAFIQEGDNKFEGVEAINSFLHQYEEDVKAWNQDRCDMWFFD